MSSATFYPGQDGYDYLMPDLNIISPSPQRIMPEVPHQIADSLGRLELEADGPNGDRRGNNARGLAPGFQHQQNPYHTPPSSGHGSRPESDYDNRSSYQSTSSANDGYTDRFSQIEEPTYSPFPRLVNPGPNIPPTDEEKELQIEGARIAVLSSNDPEMQLIWAQDALNFVEIAMNHLTRISEPPGQRPQTPALEHQIKTDAINVVSFLADQHHPRGEFMRGNWLEFGKFGFRLDKKEAFRCYARAAEKGYARAEYRMGMQFENSNEPMKAIRHYNNGAELGDSASNYRLGMMTLLGQHGQKQDYARGVHLIRMAAAQADENAPQGAYVFGMLLARELPGIEVPEAYLPIDILLAREMIEKAAFLGFARAQLKMGTAYELCQLGCDFDPALSLHYNALAARQGEPEADMAISKWFLCGHPGVFDKNEELAFIYAQRAARSGLGTAEFALGYFYEIGMYAPVDLKEAQRWYAKAAAHGNKDANGRIDGIARSKTLSKKDHESVAISKIRARHGSQRQKVNPRTQNRSSVAQPNVGTIQEGPPTAYDMPDPMMQGGPAPGPGYPPDGPLPPGRAPPGGFDMFAPGPPVRKTSMPMPNREHEHHAPQRPGTAVPYPEHSGPRPGSSHALAPVQPLRPSSSHGREPGPPFRKDPSYRRPANRPPSANAGMPLPAGMYPPQSPLRPASSMSNMSSGSPRRPPHQQQRPPPGPGYPEGPGPGPGPAPLGYPPAGGAPPPHHRPAPIDIGFEAPAPSAAPRPPHSPAPSGAPSSTSYGTAPSHKTGISKSPSPNPGQMGGAMPPPSPAPSSKAPSTPGKAGKGPKTFEEMGVAKAEKEAECVIM